MSSVVGTKGQVTIQKEIRDALGIAPGWRAIQRPEGDRVVLEFLPPRHRRSVVGILKGKARMRFATSEYLERAIDQAWTYAAEDAAGTEGATS
jgi:AbrB family looped-hinge helix DNA binding protein